MRRLNVRPAQIDECIQKSMFAFSVRPQNPELQPGELLLLQLVKAEAARLGKLHSRIDFALVFDHIEPRDERLILPYIQWSLAEVPKPTLQYVPASQVAQKFGQELTLSAIYNHDRIAVLHAVPRRMVSVEEFVRNQYLADSLKSYYENRCQICGKDFYPDYGVAYSETHHVQYLARGGPDISGNIVVICPNHHRIIHATDARFDRQSLTYEYPNGLREPLILPDHFVKAPQLSTL